MLPIRRSQVRVLPSPQKLRKSGTFLFQVIAVDLVRERIERARRHGIEVHDARDHADVPDTMREITDSWGSAWRSTRLG